MPREYLEIHKNLMRECLTITGGERRREAKRWMRFGLARVGVMTCKNKGPRRRPGRRGTGDAARLGAVPEVEELAKALTQRH
jgi:hypothetical protein